MRKITKEKNYEPQELSTWKKKNKVHNYKKITKVERDAIKRECLTEQYFLCAYCCQRVNLDSNSSSRAVNEHVMPRDKAPQLQLTFSNIVASCSTKSQCDNKHGSQIIPLTPLMKECETELKFRLNGQVEGLTQRAKDTIEILNLGDKSFKNRGLIARRKKAIDAILYEFNDTLDISFDDEVLNKDFISSLNTEEDGMLAPFSPVLINIIKQNIL